MIGYLYAGDAESDSSIVNLVVAEVLEQRVADLCQTQSLFAVNNQTHDRDAAQSHSSHLHHTQSPQPPHAGCVLI